MQIKFTELLFERIYKQYIKYYVRDVDINKIRESTHANERLYHTITPAQRSKRGGGGVELP